MISDRDLDVALIERADNSLHEFVRLAWPLVENVPFTDGRIIGEVCDHLQAVSEGHIKNLILNQPPGTTKSLLVQVFWPTWDWIRHEIGRKWIFASYDASLTRRDAARALNLINAPWFIERWGIILRDVKPGAGEYWTKAGGMRFATSVKGRATGRHADIQVVDDPIKPKDALGGINASDAALKECGTWWDQTMSTRVTDAEKSARVIIMQRVHEKDLAGICLDRGYTHLCLPMRFEEKRKCITFYKRTKAETKEIVEVKGGDWRTKEGELLWPPRFSEEGVKRLEDGLGGLSAVSAQLQQNPTPTGGLIFKETEIRYWHPQGADVLDPHGRPCVPLPKRGGLKALSLDAAFKGSDGSDRCSLGVWWYHSANHYLIDNDTTVYEFVDMIAAIKGMVNKWPLATEKLIEDKANGSAAISTLKGTMAGITAVEPMGGKIDRANACSPLFRSGTVFVPHPDLAPWVQDYVSEMTSFPFGKYDDQVDMTTQALLHFQSGTAVWEAAMNRI